MLIKLDKLISAESIASAEKKLSASKLKRQAKGFDAKRFAGIISWKDNAVTLQRKWRSGLD